MGLRQAKYISRGVRASLTGILSIVLFYTSNPLFSQEKKGIEPATINSNRLKLTYETFADLVEKAHPERSIDQRRLEISKQNEQMVGVLPDPQLTMGKKGISLDETAPKAMMPSSEMEAWTFGISQSFPWPGTLAAEESAAKSLTESVQTDVNLANVSRYFKAKQLFLSIIKTAKFLEVERSNLGEVKKILKFAEEKFRQGIGSHMEVLRAQSESAILKANIETLEAELANLKSHALVIINRPDGLKADFILEFPEKYLIDESYDKAASKHSNLPLTDLIRKKIVAMRERQLAQKEQMYHQTLPRIMASGNIMQMESGQQTYSAMIGINIPIFSHKKRQALSSQKALIEAQVADQLAWHEKQKQLALNQVDRSIERIKANLHVLTDEVIPATKEHLATVLVQYTQGAGRIEEIIESQQMLLTQEMSAISNQEALALAKLTKARILVGLATSSDVEAMVPSLPITLTGRNMSGMNSMGMKKGSPMKMRKDMPMQRSERNTTTKDIPESDMPSSMPSMGM